jgi:glucose-6-phosphate 1-dehydrogenase
MPRADGERPPQRPPAYGDRMAHFTAPAPPNDTDTENGQPPPDQDLVLVGATGDLARRKLLPALYEMSRTGMLPRHGAIIGYARTEPERGDFRALALAAVADGARETIDPAQVMRFVDRLQFVHAEAGALAEVQRRCTQDQRLVYLATPPGAYASIARELQQAGLADDARLVIEKPFGSDLNSARALHRELSAIVDESRLFRIDHYLGKETVRNILVFRFGNSLFERSWNRDAIDHVQLTVAEADGVESRGAFYEEVGALRDVMQNHLLQLLALLAMEPPGSFSADAVRAEQAKLLQAVQPMSPMRFVRGQYTTGGHHSGYRDEPGVDPDSEAETYAAAEVRIDNWRWSGVPFYLRTGKRLARRVTELQVVFRAVPTAFFMGAGVAELPDNHLTIRIQPEQGISFNFAAKVPGPRVLMHPARMQYRYGAEDDAYERLLYDAMRGDQTLFVREDALEAAWRIVQPILDAPPPLHFYPAGSWGPSAADALIHPRAWHLH